MGIMLMTTVIYIVLQGCVLCISSDNPFSSTMEDTRGCGAYKEVLSFADGTDRIADNSRPLIEFGGVASLHSSTTNFGSATHKCGAVLISSRHLLTAAHCMVVEDKPLSISLGRPDLDEDVSPSPDNNIYLIEEVIIHPAYKSETHERHDYNDLAILITRRTVKYTNRIWPLCLPVRGQVFPDYWPSQIAGWGFVNHAHKVSTIKEAFVKIVHNERCVNDWSILAPQSYAGIQQFSYPQGLGSKILCAGRLGVDACNGDSGGPMAYQSNDSHYIVIGIIAKGIPCGDVPKLPGFYTNVAEFTHWIYEKTGLSEPQASSLPSRHPETGFNATPDVDHRESTTFCPRLFGKFADPNPVACDTYYNCLNGIPKKIVCSPGLHFNKDSATCSLPKDANRQNCGENQGNATLCPSPYGKFADPNPMVCDTFYNCLDGIPKKIVCSPGLHFNKKSATCSLPKDANRQSCGQIQVCQQLYGTFADPDPAVCNTYYDCINGVPKKVVCSSGLHFDKKAGTCSWPRLAGRQNCGKTNPVDCNPTCQRGTCNGPNKCSCTTSWSTDRCNKEFYGAASAGEVSFIQDELSTRSSSDLRLNWRNKDNYNYTALHTATSQDKLPVVRALLDAGASADMQSDAGHTPVYIAARYGHIAVLRLLLEPTYKADVNLPTNTGETPVYTAVGEGHTAALKVLIAHGGDVNKLRNNGSSPLILASQRGHIEAVRALLNASANVDYAFPIHGSTALHSAAWNNHADVASLLLQNNADKIKENNFGETPADMATRYGYDAVAEIITNYNNS